MAGVAADRAQWAAASVVAPQPSETVDEIERPDEDAEQRARFAAAIARAEFGRFYFKEHIGKPAKERKQGRKPARNRKG